MSDPTPIDHALTLDASLRWALVCVHAPGDCPSLNEDGTKDSDECWVRSHWENLDPTEIISEASVWPPITTLPIPVDVEGTGWDGVLLVPHQVRGDRPMSDPTAAEPSYCPCIKVYGPQCLTCLDDCFVDAVSESDIIHPAATGAEGEPLAPCPDCTPAPGVVWPFATSGGSRNGATA